MNLLLGWEKMNDGTKARGGGGGRLAGERSFDVFLGVGVEIRALESTCRQLRMRNSNRQHMRALVTNLLVVWRRDK